MISLSSPIETWAHRWRAGPKLLALCLATVVLFQMDRVVPLVLCAGGVLVLYAAPGMVFLRVGLGRLRPLWPFVALLVGWHVLLGEPALGAGLGLRMVIAVALANLVTMTTRLDDMMAVVMWLSAPLGKHARAIGLAMALVIRIMPELVARGRGLALAWRARSSRRPGWRVIVPFVALALDDADHVAEALRARGGL